jgi:ferredoxin-NADP reductase
VLITTPLFFFAFVILTEPLTTPPTKGLQIGYGVLVGVLFAPWVHIGSFYFTPEIALLAGNIFAYLVSPKQKLLLTLHEKIPVAADVYDFRFKADKKLPFRPGQYLEWTLSHGKADNRGNRRYFTISSSPTEPTIDIGVKFYPKSSTYKKELLEMQRGDTLIASQLSGDFTMPHDPKKKLVFVAGGIGVTPFRSMIKYLLDTKEQRDIVLLYSNRTKEDIAYKDVFDEAKQKLGMKTVYTLTNQKTAPRDWQGYTGYIDRQMIEREVPDYRERDFYLSGPNSMIIAFEQTLHAMGIGRSQIKKDFFPGFA